MTLEELLASLRTRSFSGAAAIGFAGAYIGTLGVGSKGLAAQLGVDQARITAALKDAANKLVWTDPEANVTGGAVKLTDGGVLLFGKSDRPEDERRAIGDNAVMKFENILTTKQTDRDGDDLDPKGAEVDPAAPLLWQHLPDAPIGKMYKVIEQNSELVKTACGIANTALGHDAATLVEFGALRISHGFKPKEFEPKGNKADGEDGWNITKYSVMEISLVSIPANVGAIITAFEKNKLASAIVKGYATSLNALRTKSVVSGWGGTKAAEPTPNGVTVNVYNQPAAADVKGKPPARVKGKDTDSDGDATTDDDDKPADDDAADTAKAPAMFREVLDAVKALAKDKSLPDEARARAGLVLSMMKEAGVRLAEYMKAIQEAGKNMDIAGVSEAAAGLVAECYASLTRAADEMGRVGEVAGVPDGALKAIGETRDAVATIVAALDDLVGGGAAATDPADDLPPIDPVDGDDDDNGNPDDAADPADDETDEDGKGVDDWRCSSCGKKNPPRDMLCGGCGADNPEPLDLRDDDDAAEKTDDDDAAEKTDDDDTEAKSEDCPKCGGTGVLTSDTGSRRDCDRCDGEGKKAADDDTDEKADDDDTDEKDGEINDGNPNPEVTDEPNPGMDDADKAAAKSLADLFGEPGVVYDRATLDMLRELTADAAN